MKKLFLIIVCTLMVTTISAQRAMTSSTSFFSVEKSEQPVTIGIRAGLNMSNMTFGYSDNSRSRGTRTTFNVGMSVDFPLLESVYLQTGLYCNEKGMKDGDSDWIAPLYLDVPVLASYRYNFSESTQLQFNVGPYFAYGIGGKAKDGDYDDKFDVFGDDSDLSRFDCGIQIGAGVTFGKIYLGCAYQFGLYNIYNDDDDDDYFVKNKNFLINVGYNF